LRRYDEDAIDLDVLVMAETLAGFLRLKELMVLEGVSLSALVDPFSFVLDGFDMVRVHFKDNVKYVKKMQSRSSWDFFDGLI
jgi:hypothetical protein